VRVPLLNASLTNAIFEVSRPTTPNEVNHLFKTAADGNDLGCLLPPEVAVPLATYTGWNLRRRDAGAEGMLASLLGSLLPFPKSAEEAKSSGDPRRPIRQRYESFQHYERQFRDYCLQLVRLRYLLREDVEPLVATLGKQRKLFE
jgi:hypothetical protein